MSKSIMLVKGDYNAFYPATDHDAELVAAYKYGNPVKASVTQQTPRSLQHHRLYWAGLIGLAMQYWNPSGGVISAAEKQTVKMLAGYVERKGYDPEPTKELCRAFLTELKQTRINSMEAPHKDAEGLHRWIKEEAGYFTWVKTPGGLEKRLDSINFNAMSKEDFERFYKCAFSVVWCFILHQNFKTEAEAQNVINQLTQMG